MDLSAIIPHLLTVIGMLAVAVGGWIFQWKSTKLRIVTEVAARRESERLDRLRELISELVTRTEPDDPERPQPRKIVRLVNRIQLQLDLEHPAESQFNGTLNHFARVLTDSGDRPIPRRDFFELHARLLDHGRQALRLTPMP